MFFVFFLFFSLNLLHSAATNNINNECIDLEIPNNVIYYLSDKGVDDVQTKLSVLGISLNDNLATFDRSFGLFGPDGNYLKYQIKSPDYIGYYPMKFDIVTKNETLWTTQLSSNLDNDPDYLKLFDLWSNQYGYNFTNKKLYSRFLGQFTKNSKEIYRHNSFTYDYRLSHNEFSHLSKSEYYKNMLGYNHLIHSIPSYLHTHTHHGDDLPERVDWRENNAVTSVKNQGQCGSCWTFSTTGALEGVYAIKNKKLISFSEQELVSCDTTDSGCNGGLMDNAFKWVEKHGLCSEKSYPYISGNGSESACNKSCNPVPNSQVIGYVDVNATETDLMSAVSKNPVSIAIEADQLGFQMYSSGVLTAECGTSLDHGVLLVGYGTDEELGLDYWLIKNSWGESWGENGYIRIQRGKNVDGGQCGILLSASYPIM